MIWTDEQGRAWEVVDCWRQNLDGPRKRLPLRSHQAEMRAFVPQSHESPVMIYTFGRIAYRETTDRILRDQLSLAKPTGANTRGRMDR